MADYTWPCPACGHAVDLWEETCTLCNCPKQPTSEQLESFSKRSGKQYVCIKCGHTCCEIGEIRVAGNIFTSLFDIESKKFTHVTCAHCRYTEFYKGSKSTLGGVVDFLMGG